MYRFIRRSICNALDGAEDEATSVMPFYKNITNQILVPAFAVRVKGLGWRGGGRGYRESPKNHQHNLGRSLQHRGMHTKEIDCSKYDADLHDMSRSFGLFICNGSYKKTRDRMNETQDEIMRRGNQTSFSTYGQN